MRGRFTLRTPIPEGFESHPVALGLQHLQQLHEARLWSTPAELLDRLIRERGVLETAIASGNPRDMWRRLRFVVDQARAWVDAGGVDLRAYLRWARLQGEDNARESVAIWPAPKHDVNNISIFIGGLSGETHRMYKVTDGGDTPLKPGLFIAVKRLNDENGKINSINDSIKNINPDATEADLKKVAQVEKLPVVLRKTLMLQYHTPGDETHTGVKPFVFKKQEWVIR